MGAFAAGGSAGANESAMTLIAQVTWAIGENTR
jgi:hypothetical protein